MNRRDLGLILLTAIGLIGSLPPFPTGFLAVATLVPFFFFLESASLRSAAIGGYVVGLLWAAGTVYWIGWATGPGLAGILLAMPAFFTVFSVVLFFLRKTSNIPYVWIAPFLWTGMEILTSLGALAFPWNSLSYSLTKWPVFLQLASVTGMYGITFLICLLNTFLHSAIRRIMEKKKPVVWLAVACIMILGVFIYGRAILTRYKDNGESLRLSLVQGNIDPYKKWTPSFIDSNTVVYQHLTRRVSSDSTDLIVWPETATACFLRNKLKVRRIVQNLVDSLGVSLLTGSPDYSWAEDGTLNTYNGVLLIRPQTSVWESYHKIHLVPFSERVPGIESFPWINRLAECLNLEIGDYNTGDSIVVFSFVPKSMNQTIFFSVIICFESVFPNLVRQFVERGAEFLVIITNDGWFGKTSGPYQHAQIAVMRAVENRIWIARCANTGISSFIDPLGRIRASSRLNEEAVLSHLLFLRRGFTWFNRHGSLIPPLIGVCNGLFLVLGIGIVFRKKVIKRPTREPNP